MTLVRLAARPLLASMFVVGGIDSLRTAPAKADAAEPVTDRLVPLLQKLVPQLSDDPTTLVRINGAVQVAAGLALATGRMPRLSSAVLAATLVPTTAAGHRFWEETGAGPEEGPARPVLQERLDDGRADAGRRGHRGQAGRRLARPPRRGRRTPRGQGAGQERASRGQARPGAADLSPGSGPSPSVGSVTSVPHRLSRRAVVVGALGGLAACSAEDSAPPTPDLGRCHRQRNGHALRHGHVHTGDRTDEGRLAAAGQVGTGHARAPVRPDVRPGTAAREPPVRRTAAARRPVRAVGPGRRGRAGVRAGPRHPGGGAVGWPQLPGLVGRRRSPGVGDRLPADERRHDERQHRHDRAPAPPWPRCTPP